MINNARMTIGQIPIVIILNMVLLHSSTNQCYNLLNKVIKHNTPIPSLSEVVRGFLGVTIVAYFFLSLRLRSQCANNATIQPLAAVVMM